MGAQTLEGETIVYLQITTRCNMSCPHCCYNCTKDGEDMSLDTFRQALELCSEYDQSPFIGGGEPTLHPQFETFLLEAIATPAEGKVGIITNGSITRRAMMVARLSEADVIYGEVSQDEYHDPISPNVVEAFGKLGQGFGGQLKGVRDTSNGGSREPMPHGRGAELLEWDEPTDESDCPCEDLLISPNGDIHQCGCQDSPIVGYVKSGIDTPSGTCYHSPEFAKHLEAYV